MEGWSTAVKLRTAERRQYRKDSLLFHFHRNGYGRNSARPYNNNNGNDNAQSREADMNMYQVHLLPRNPRCYGRRERVQRQFNIRPRDLPSSQRAPGVAGTREANFQSCRGGSRRTLSRFMSAAVEYHFPRYQFPCIFIVRERCL